MVHAGVQLSYEEGYHVVPLETLLVALYVLVEDWWRDNRSIARCGPGRPVSLSDAEVLALAILSQWPRFRSERDFWRFANAHLRPYFPSLVGQSQLNRRIRALEPELRALQRHLSETLADGSEVYRVLDTTLVPAVVRVRACRKGLFAGQASFGRNVSKTEWVYGFKVALAVNPEGVVTAFGLAPANSDERPIGEYLIRSDGHDAFLADKGFSSLGLGEALVGGLRGAGGGHPAKERAPGLAGGSVPVGCREAADHRGGDLAAEGLLRLGASPGEDPGRAAGPAGSQGRRLHLRADAQRGAGSAATRPGLPSGLNDCTSPVLGL